MRKPQRKLQLKLVKLGWPVVTNPTPRPDAEDNDEKSLLDLEDSAWCDFAFSRGEGVQCGGDQGDASHQTFHPCFIQLFVLLYFLLVSLCSFIKTLSKYQIQLLFYMYLSCIYFVYVVVFQLYIPSLCCCPLGYDSCGAGEFYSRKLNGCLLCRCGVAIG